MSLLKEMRQFKHGFVMALKQLSVSCVFVLHFHPSRSERTARSLRLAIKYRASKYKHWFQFDPDSLLQLWRHKSLYENIAKLNKNC